MDENDDRKSGKRHVFSKGWDEIRVQRLLRHFTFQTEEQAIEEDEADLKEKSLTKPHNWNQGSN